MAKSEIRAQFLSHHLPSVTTIGRALFDEAQLRRRDRGREGESNSPPVTVW